MGHMKRGGNLSDTTQWKKITKTHLVIERHLWHWLFGNILTEIFKQQVTYNMPVKYNATQKCDNISLKTVLITHTQHKYIH